jgi:ribosomal protein S21
MAKVQKTLVVQVQKKENESPANLLKRFTRRVQESKILPHAKKNRFKARQESTLKKKEKALKRISRQKRVDTLKKMGKMD